MTRRGDAHVTVCEFNSSCPRQYLIGKLYILAVRLNTFKSYFERGNLEQVHSFFVIQNFSA